MCKSSLCFGPNAQIYINEPKILMLLNNQRPSLLSQRMWFYDIHIGLVSMVVVSIHWIFIGKCQLCLHSSQKRLFRAYFLKTTKFIQFAFFKISPLIVSVVENWWRRVSARIHDIRRRPKNNSARKAAGCATVYKIYS